MSWRSLRVQLAVLGFLAIYGPVLILLGVSEVTETTVIVDGVEVTEGASTERSPWTTATVAALGPIAAGLAWWLAGRAVRPIDRVRSVAEDIGGSDLSRRIELERGPAEVVALADSFDAMLDRLEHAADGQRRLVEETSHELRTPLAVLAMNAEVLLAHPRPTVEVFRTGLERSRATIDRLQATIDDLLVDARARADAIDRHPVDLVAIATAAVEDARPLAERKGVDLVVAGSPPATGALDGPTVQRAIANLLDNAIRFAPAGTAVEVVITIDGADATVTVTDHGPGIAPDDQAHVFERFWRGRSDGRGSGLGLPIARQVALAHGGEVTVRSPGPDGDGSAFELRLRR